jgi:hypothetical protein
MKKERIERNLLFPSQQFRHRVRSAARERGFRSEQAFILAACNNDRSHAVKYGQGGTVSLHAGTHAGGAHELPLAVRSDLRT